MIEQPSTATTLAGWFPDPMEEHNLRYHDGTEWTAHVTHFGPSPCEGCHQPEPAPAGSS